MKAITGFEIEPLEFRGTRKFNQHKTGADLHATIDDHPFDLAPLLEWADRDD